MLRAAAILTIAFAFFSSPALAKTCSAPSGPDMTASGDSLSVESFNQITDGLTAFDSGLKDYRACLDHVINSPEDNTQEEWRAALEAYNNISTEQAALYERYDVVAKDFQSAQAKRASTAANQAKESSANETQAELAAELAMMNQ